LSDLKYKFSTLEVQFCTFRRDGNKILCKVKDTKILKLVANMQAVFCSDDK